MFQSWHRLLFAHWEADPEIIQATLPPGLTVETFQGRAYLGLVPFFMRRVRPAGMPSLPWISNFLEFNVRTYVQDREGTPGVWFYSLDCNQPIAVWIAQSTLGLPYRHARMRALLNPAGTVRYRSLRCRSAARADFQYTIDPGVRHAEPGSLEFFLVERYVLFTQLRGRLFKGQVHHTPYPLADTKLRSCKIAKLDPRGFPYEQPPQHVIGSLGVDVDIFPAEAVPQ
jgi:uncharacterized protein